MVVEAIGEQYHWLDIRCPASAPHHNKAGRPSSYEATITEAVIRDGRTREFPCPNLN
jgi:hypothetical protein